MNKEFAVSLGNVLRAKRNKLDISQEKLAEQAGVDRTYISILERGLKSPTLDTFGKICAALSILPEQVIKEARRK